MAKLFVHGGELGQIEFTTYRKAYFADGTILINRGSGWKKWRKRVGDPAAAYKSLADRFQQYRETHPEFVRYQTQLHHLCNLRDRWKLHAAVQLMPTDPDGIWSEMSDDQIHLGVDEIGLLCDAYLAAEKEKAS